MYVTGYLYFEDDWWERERSRLAWQLQRPPAPAPAPRPDALERIPRLTGELASSIVEASAHASIDTVCEVVEATCDELRERVFNRIVEDADDGSR
jgi:hypothetical protein